MMSKSPAYLPDFLDMLVELEEYRSKLLQFMISTNTDVMIGPAAPVPAALHGHGYDGFPENGFRWTKFACSPFLFSIPKGARMLEERRLQVAIELAERRG